MTTIALDRPQRLGARAAQATPRRRFGLLFAALRRKKPTLFQKCLAVHMANTRGWGRFG